MGQRVFAVIEALALAFWIGALAGFAFVFAPIAFRIVDDLDRFAALTGALLQSLGFLGLACGTIAIVAAGFRARDERMRPAAALRIGLIAAMLVLGAYENSVVVPKMAATAQTFHWRFGSIPKTDSRRARYAILHRESSLVYGAALLLGITVIALAAAGTPDAAQSRIPRR